MSPFGEMAEWTKARDSKSRIPQGVGGSNPSLSAIRVYFRRKSKLFKVGGFPFHSSNELNTKETESSVRDKSLSLRPAPFKSYEINAGG